jgi:hypothetical protein
MSITTTSTKDSYTGNNSTSTPYPITFKYLEDSHITVYVDGVALSNSYYTLAGDGSLGTGQFTTSVAYADTKKVIVVLDVPFNQPVELLETGVLSSSTLEEAYDRLNMQIRRVWRKAQSVLTFSSDEGGAGSTGTADTLVGFDGSGDLGEIPNATFLQTANDLSDVTASTARTNLNVDVAGTDNSTDVTKTGNGTYVSLAGQVLTVDKIDEGDLNASINASLNLADTSIQSLANIEATSLVSTGATVGQVLQADGDDGCSFIDLTGGGNALTSNPLSQFATTTSAQLAGVISDETGTGALVFADNPVIDLTNATNVPVDSVGTDQIINGSIAKNDLGTGVKASLDLADTAIQTETNGTVQGTDGTYDIRSKDEGAVAGNARGESSVDLQTERSAADQVASGDSSALVGGKNNTASGSLSSVLGGESNASGGVRTSIIGGLSNSINATNPNAVILGGNGNQMTGVGGTNTILSAKDSTCTAGFYNLVVGQQAHDGGFSGCKIFADSTTTPFTAKAAQEFAVQAGNIRLEVGTPAVGDVLTCNHVDGSSGWASPATVSYASYSVTDGSISSDGRLQLTEDLDPSGIGTVSAGLITLGAGTYQITHYGEYYEADSNAGSYWLVHTRHNSSNLNTFIANENQTVGTPNPYYHDRCFSSIITSASSQTVDIYGDEISTASLQYRNVKLSILKLA